MERPFRSVLQIGHVFGHVCNTARIAQKGNALWKEGRRPKRSAQLKQYKRRNIIAHFNQSNLYQIRLVVHVTVLAATLDTDMIRFPSLRTLSIPIH